MVVGGRCGSGGGRGDWDEVGRGKVGEGVVEEVGDVGVAGGKVGGGNVDLGMTAFSLSVRHLCYRFLQAKTYPAP